MNTTTQMQVRSAFARRAILCVSVLAFNLCVRDISAQRGTDTQFPNSPVLVTDLALKDLNNKPIQLKSAQGKVVLLNFWATWCGPCREEIPVLVALQAKHENDLQVIGLIIDDDKDEARKLIKELTINYPVAEATLGLRNLYGGVPAVPTSLIFDSGHKMMKKCIGIYDFGRCESEIGSLLRPH